MERERSIAGNSRIDEIIKLHAERINHEKQKILKERVFDIGGESALYKFNNNRFKGVVCETQRNGDELYYYDDGSENGKLILTVYPAYTEFDQKDNIFTFNLKYK